MARSLAVLAFVSLVACGAGRDRGPAWPQRAEPAVDGGESLAPRTASVVAASETKDATEAAATTEDATEIKAADTKAADKPAETKAAPTTSTDDVIIIDDIVIEIEE